MKTEQIRLENTRSLLKKKLLWKCLESGFLLPMKVEKINRAILTKNWKSLFLIINKKKTTKIQKCCKQTIHSSSNKY